MGKETGIAWCDSTFNAWWGCTKVDPLCDNCYAEAWDKRTGGKHWGEGAPRRTFGEKHWAEPRKWNAAAEKVGKRHRVFCSSMADVFDKDAPPGELDRLWALIRETPWLDWQLLTKRANRIAESLPHDWDQGYPNVWLGVSVGTVKGLWRAKALADIPAEKRFISYEPALELVDFRPVLIDFDWLICGAESGPHARPMPEEWARSARDQCQMVGCYFFLKQYADERGRKISLPLLDGRQWAEFPQ